MSETIHLQSVSSSKKSVATLPGSHENSKHGIITDDSADPDTARASFSDSMKKAVDDSSTENPDSETGVNGKKLPGSSEKTAADDRDILNIHDTPVLSESDEEPMLLLDPQVLPLDLRQGSKISPVLTDGSQVSGISKERVSGTNISADLFKTGQSILSDSETHVTKNTDLPASTLQQLSTDSIFSSSGVAALNNQDVKNSMVRTNKLSSDMSTVQTDSSVINLDDVGLDDMPLAVQKTQLIKQMLAASTAQLSVAADLQTMSASNPLVTANSAVNILPTTASPTTATFPSMLQAMPQVLISEQFGRADWSQGMSKQILWLANQNIKSAEIRLNPAHLGPVEVRLDINDDQINVALSSRHAVVREAMEAALPKLRDMLDSNGMSLSDTDISQHSFAEQREQHSEKTSGHAFNTSASQTETVQNQNIPLNLKPLSSSMVDYFI